MVYIVSMTDVEPGAKRKFDINRFISQLETPSPGHINKEEGTIDKSQEVPNKLAAINLRQADLKEVEGGLRRAFLALGNKYPDWQDLIVRHIRNKAEEDRDYEDLLDLF